MFIKIKKVIKRIPWVWYNLRNREFRDTPEPLGVDLKCVVDGLTSKGIVNSDFEIIFPDVSWDTFYADVYKAVGTYEKDGSFAEHNDKDYMSFVLGLNPIYEGRSLWSRIAEHHNLRSIAKSYFKMSRVDMRYYNIWKNEAASGEPSGSQLWHRDREDVKILKVFICIENVDDINGPFTYAPGTHMEGNIKGEPTYRIENHQTHRTTDDMMDKLVPRENWVKATGKKGSIIFADTNGYHKGGYVQEGRRLLFVAMYVSPASERFYFKHSIEK
jgi:hypothetical protein